MALIEVFHVVASELQVDANSSTDIPQGVLVTLDSNGLVTLCDGDTQYATGIAGDSRSTGVTSYSPESGSSLSRDPKSTLTGALVIGALGAQQRFTQNRVADQYNEVLASGKMTVYHGGGEFWTDQYELVQSDGSTVITYTPMARLYAAGANETANVALESSIVRSGRFTTESSTTTQIVGYVLTTPTDYPSGVPGTETAFSALPEGGNSMTWGRFLHVKLSV